MADRGTAMHTAVETGLDDFLSVEELGLVTKARDYIAPLLEKADQVHKEIRLEIGQVTWGTSDMLCIRGRHGDQVDFKFGFGGVDHASNNLQGWAYVLGAFELFPDLQTITMHFVLPRRDEVSVHSFDRSEMRKMLVRISRVVARSEEFAGITYTPNDSACLYCGRRAMCPAIAKTAMAIADKYDEDFELPAEYHASAITDPRQMAKALNVARVMEKWSDAVKHHATDLVKSGVEIPGYVLRERAATRTVKGKDVVLAQDAFLNVLTLDEFLAACTLSVKSLEDAVANKAPRGKKKEAAERVPQILAGEQIYFGSGEATQYLAKVR